MLRCVLVAALFCSTPALAGSVRASSELETSAGERHPASLAVDGSLLTSWGEGVLGVGEGEWIELTFDRPTEVASISLWPGDLRKGKRSIRENGRPRMVTVSM